MVKKKAKTKEVAVVKSEVVEKKNDVVEQENNVVQVETLISQAIQQNIPVESMERILAMRRELRAEQAKEKFDSAMANFQGACPVIKKEKAGGRTKGGQVAYYYAPLESIVAQIKDLIQSFGLSYSINTKTLDEKVFVACTVKHIAGHSESSEIEMPLGAKTGVMSAPQVVAAALTFAKRYAFCNAFGILTGDDDNDAQTQTYNQPQTVQVKAIPLATEEQKQQIVAVCEKLGGTVNKLVQAGKIPPFGQLTVTGANKAIDDLDKILKSRQTTRMPQGHLTDTSKKVDQAELAQMKKTVEKIGTNANKTTQEEVKTTQKNDNLLTEENNLPTESVQKTEIVGEKTGDNCKVPDHCEKCGTLLNNIEKKSLEKGEKDFIDGDITYYKFICAKCQIALGYT